MALLGKLEIIKPKSDKANDRFVVTVMDHDFVLLIYSLTLCAHSALIYVFVYWHCSCIPGSFELLLSYLSKKGITVLRAI